MQLLPVNDVSGGADPSPYAATSAFAIDPVYLSIDACEDFQAAGGREALPPEVREKIALLQGASLVDWTAVRAVKQVGVELAFQNFVREHWQKRTPRALELATFTKGSRAWLEDYALFTVLHQKHRGSWVDWPVEARDRDPAAIAAAREEDGQAILRVEWLQWQIESQWRRARREASAAGVELMGDLPFVVGIDSADVWSNRQLFRIDQHVGAPPEEGAPDGQDWGLPVYDWSVMQRDDFAWLRARAIRAGEMFSLYRIDHAIGLYRTYFKAVDGKTSGFSPGEEGAQMKLGETLLRVMSRFGEVVAEDLGTVPPFVRQSLERLAIPGYRVLRWEKNGDDYRDPAGWPVASVATNATHDTDTTAGWYDRLSPEERERLRKIPGMAGLDVVKPFDDEVRDRLLRVLYAAPSILTLVPYQDAMGTRDRINTPGSAEPTNWCLRADRTIEELVADHANSERLWRLASEAGRGPITIPPR